MSTVVSHLSLNGKDVARILNVSLPTANRRIKVVKSALNLPKYKRISLSNLCEIFKLNELAALENLAKGQPF